MSIYITGDTHGDLVSRFSWKRHPELRSWTKDDVVFVLGDIGVPWGGSEIKNDLYQLDFLRQKPPTFIFILGNHENYDEIDKMPTVKKFGAELVQCVYEGQTFNNIFYVKDLAVLDIEDEHILCISHAESHDIWNLLDPQDPNFKAKKKKLHIGDFYRVIGQSWWPQEKMNVEKMRHLLEPHRKDHFTLILSHDYPAAIYQYYRDPFRVETEGQCFLEELRHTLDFDAWIHGHAHDEFLPWKEIDDRILCLYHSIITFNEVNND